MTLRPLTPGLLSLAAVLAVNTADAQPASVTKMSTGAGTYLMTENDRSLYWNGREVTSGEIVCVEDCLETWAPLKADSTDSEAGEWTIVERPDETLQWAYKGRPLYTFAGDTFPGARLGDGAGRGNWSLVFEFNTVPPGMKIESTLLGYVLADHTGKTLYARTATDAGGDQTAEPDMTLWQPVEAPWLALDQGDYTTQAVAGGSRQWTFKGRRLYTYRKDVDPFDVHGHGADGEWQAVILEKAPGLPDWMTIQWLDLGLAYADENGMTLYAPVDIEAIKTAQTCPEDCMEENWIPVLARPEEQSVGNWVIRENEAGQQQWSYRGRFLYTHTRDAKPGNMRGNGVGVGYRIGDGWRIVPVEAGFRRSRT